MADGFKWDDRGGSELSRCLLLYRDFWLMSRNIPGSTSVGSYRSGLFWISQFLSIVQWSVQFIHVNTTYYLKSTETSRLSPSLSLIYHCALLYINTMPPTLYNAQFIRRMWAGLSLLLIKAGYHYIYRSISFSKYYQIPEAAEHAMHMLIFTSPSMDIGLDKLMNKEHRSYGGCASKETYVSLRESRWSFRYNHAYTFGRI